MNSDPSAEQMNELEQKLRSRPGFGAPADLRLRVLQAVDAELALARATPARPRAAGWYWLAIAAAALIAMNLSQIDATRTQFSGRISIGVTAGYVEFLQEIRPIEPGANK